MAHYLGDHFISRIALPDCTRLNPEQWPIFFEH